MKDPASIRVLVACEESQAVCIAFRERGFEAYSCDIQPCSGGHPEWHLQGDVFDIINDGWDLMIGHPPCTFMANSGVRWLYGGKQIKIPISSRWTNLASAMRFFNRLKGANINSIGLENPIPHKYAINGFKLLHSPGFAEGIGMYSQLIQPWQFGHGETKATCIWLKNLPPLISTEISTGREGKCWKIPPSPERSKIRSKTFPGIARAMAQQWGDFILNEND